MNLKSEQRALAMLTLYRGKIDGIEGGKTRAARDQFRLLEKIGDDADFSGHLKQKIFTLPLEDYQHPNDLADTVKKVCQSFHYDDPRLWAYIMATVKHETNNTYYPVEEAYYIRPDSRREAYQTGLRYAPYHGRGLVQITWDTNYKKYQAILNNNMFHDPDEALDPPTSLFILIHGMITGTFTDLRLTDFINKHECDYKQARRVVNSMDKADLIAGYAQEWEKLYEQK